MADDTSAALIAQLDVKFDQLANHMKKAITVFDDGGRKLERRQAQIKKNLSNWALDFSGLGGLNKTLVGLTAGAVVGGLGMLVKNGLDAASAIGDTAQQAGVTVEFLQKLRFAATQSGASFDIMDTALTTLNKNLGDFVNTGAGKAAQTFKTLGIDKLIKAGDIRNAEELFDAMVKKLQGVGSEAQKSAYLASVFGKEAGPRLLQLVNEGVDGLAKLEAQAVSLGIVLSTKTVEGAKEAGDKLDALFAIMKAQGTAAVASLAPEIAQLAQQITDGLPDLITWVERWAQWFGLLRLSPVQDLKVQLQAANAEIEGIQKQRDKLAKAGPVAQGLNAFGSIFGFGTSDQDLQVLYSSALAKRKTLRDKLAAAEKAQPKPTGATTRPDALAINDIAGQKKAEADAKKAQELADRRKELLAQTGVDAATASAALLVAQDRTNVQLLKGSADYYAAVKKQIDDEYQAAVTTAEAEAEKQKATLAKKGKNWEGYADGIANIQNALIDKMAAAAEEQKQRLDEAGPTGFIRGALQAGDQQIQQYKDQADALGLVTSAAAKLAYVQQQTNDAKDRGLTLTQQEIAQIEAQGDAIGRAAQAAHDASVASADNIQTLDTLRSGLSDVGTTGITRFNDLGSAAASFGEQIANVIAQLYVMKPIINGLFGESGTGGGGLLGSFISGLFGGGGGGISGADIAWSANGNVIGRDGKLARLPRFARGGVTRTLGIFGEVPGQAEAAVPLPDGRSIPVDLRTPAIPQMPARSAGLTVIQHFDLSGAVVTDEIMANAARAGDAAARAQVSRYDTKVLPTRVAQLNKNPRNR